MRNPIPGRPRQLKREGRLDTNIYKAQPTELSNRAVSRRDPQSNRHAYYELQEHATLAVRAGNGTIIPGVPVHQFEVIGPHLPAALRAARRRQAFRHNRRKFHDGWRLSHGNSEGHLPQPTVNEQQFNIEFTAQQAQGQQRAQWHHAQRFQEYDVFSLVALQSWGRGFTEEFDEFLQSVCPNPSTISDQECDDYQDTFRMMHEGRFINEFSRHVIQDPGAMRIVVDECFQHVYFSLNHYHPIRAQDVTLKRVGKRQEEGGFIYAHNPYLLVLFGTQWELADIEISATHAAEDAKLAENLAARQQIDRQFSSKRGKSTPGRTEMRNRRFNNNLVLENTGGSDSTVVVAGKQVPVARPLLKMRSSRDTIIFEGKPPTFEAGES